MTLAITIAADVTHRSLAPGSDNAQKFEQGLADIQLLGTKTQAEMAVAIGKSLSENGEAMLDELLLSLRDDLRDELKLEPLFQPPVHIRIGVND